jgi:hypothetical protein
MLVSGNRFEDSVGDAISGLRRPLAADFAFPPLELIGAPLVTAVVSNFAPLFSLFLSV